MKYTIASTIIGLVIAGGTMASEMPAIAKKQDCDICHDISKRVVGPAWMEVSRKYKGVTKYTYNGQEYDLEDGLVMKVSKGGSGSWGAMPMPGNDLSGTKQAEMRELVRFVLSLTK